MRVFDGFGRMDICLALKAKAAGRQPHIIRRINKFASHFGCVAGADEKEIGGGNGANNCDQNMHKSTPS